MIFFAAGTPVYSQQDAAAEALILSMPDDTAKVNRLNEYAAKIQFLTPTKSISIMQLAMELSQKINYPLGLSIAYAQRAGLYFYEMKLDSSAQLLNKAYALVQANKDPFYRKHSATVKTRFAAIHQRNENYDSAVEKYLEAAQIFTELGDEDKIIYSYYNLSGMYKFLGDTAKTLYYAKETNKAAASAGDTILRIRGLIAMADAYLLLKNYDSAFAISKAGLFVAEEKQITFAIGIFNNFIGLYHTDKAGNYDLAVAHFNKALESFRKINVQYDIALVLKNLGRVYLLKKDYSNSVKFSEQALDISQQLKLSQVQHDVLMDLVKAWEGLGNTAQSYRYLLRYVAVNDSLQSRNNRKAVYELEAKYQNQKKEVMLLAQQKTIERKTLLNYIFAGGSLLLLTIFTLLFFNYRHQQKLQRQRISELETLQQLTATAAVLKGEEQERARLAKDLHDGLGGLLSGIKYSLNSIKAGLPPGANQSFERSIDMLDSSIKEIRRVSHNMMPEALLKFGLDTALKDYCHDINQTGAIRVSYQSIGLEDLHMEHTTSITVYRIVQELLGNILKHAAAKNALVQISRSGDQLSVTVEDDGKGFDAAILSHTSGIGWANVQSRVEFLKGKTDIKSEPGKGTSILVDFYI
ncbi:MAG: sensor histidine kinase [Ferruginibacter sp.]